MCERFLRSVSAAAILVAVVLVPTRAGAADGAIEINQTCAVATGCGSGDSPGFPVTAFSGRYVLTSDLVVATAGTRAIQVNGHLVWIDLAGFTVQGPGACTLPGPACAPAGTASGIASVGSGYTTVMGGTVRGFGLDGIELRNHARVVDVRASDNGRRGVTCLDGCVLRGVRAVRNGAAGISTGGHGVIVRSLAEGNGDAGMSGNQGSVFVDDTADGNGGDGIAALVGGNVVRESHARRNALNGIRASAGALVEGNTVTENGGLGLFLNATAAFGFNVIRPNPAVAGSGTVNAGSQNLGNNLCNGSTTCP